MTSLARTWPEATLAVALVALVSYLVADVVARLVQSVLRAVIEDDELEALLVDRPRRLVRLTIFLVTGTALVFPALSLAGHPTRFGEIGRAHV